MNMCHDRRGSRWARKSWRGGWPCCSHQMVMCEQMWSWTMRRQRLSDVGDAAGGGHGPHVLPAVTSQAAAQHSKATAKATATPKTRLAQASRTSGASSSSSSTTSSSQGQGSESRCRKRRAMTMTMTMTMTHSEKSHIGQMRAWPYRQERRGHGPTKKNLSRANLHNCTGDAFR